MHAYDSGATQGILRGYFATAVVRRASTHLLNRKRTKTATFSFYLICTLWDDGEIGPHLYKALFWPARDAKLKYQTECLSVMRRKKSAQS